MKLFEPKGKEGAHLILSVMFIHTLTSVGDFVLSKQRQNLDTASFCGQAEKEEINCK